MHQYSSTWKTQERQTRKIAHLEEKRQCSLRYPLCCVLDLAASHKGLSWDRQRDRQIDRRISPSCSDPSRAWFAIWTEALVQVCWFMSWWVWHFWIQLFRSSTRSKLGKNKHQVLTDASGCPWRNLLSKQIISHGLEISGVGYHHWKVKLGREIDWDPNLTCAKVPWAGTFQCLTSVQNVLLGWGVFSGPVLSAGRIIAMNAAFIKKINTWITPCWSRNFSLVR